MRNILFILTLLSTSAALQATQINLGYLEYAPEFDGNTPINMGFNIGLLDSSTDPNYGYLAPPLNTMPLRFDGIQLVLDMVQTNLTDNSTTIEHITVSDPSVRVAPSVTQVGVALADSWLQKSVASVPYSRRITRATLTASVLPGVAWRVFNGSEYVYFIPDNNNFTYTESFSFTYAPHGSNLDYTGGAQFPLVLSGFQVIPEPSSLVMAGLGLGALALARRRRR